MEIQGSPWTAWYEQACMSKTFMHWNQLCCMLSNCWSFNYNSRFFSCLYSHCFNRPNSEIQPVYCSPKWTIEWDQLNVFFLIIIDNFLIILLWIPGDMKEMFRLHDNAKSDRLWPQSRLVNYLTSSFKLLNPIVWQQKFAKASLKNSASAKYFLAHNAYKTWKWGRIFSFHTYRQEQYMKISLISNQERF